MSPNTHKGKLYDSIARALAAGIKPENLEALAVSKRGKKRVNLAVRRMMKARAKWKQEGKA